MFARLVLAVLVLAACGRSSGAAGERGFDPEAAGTTLPGDPGGAFWDAKTASLYVTDVAHDTVMRLRDREGFTTEAELPASSALGGIVRLADGRLVIASFGFGEGAVYVTANHERVLVGRLDPARRRTALAIAPDGSIYSAYFAVAPDSAPRGGISRIDPGGGEHDVVTAGLRKPLGLAATATTLYVSDQHGAALLAYARADGTPHPVMAADVTDPEVITTMPGGDAIVGTRDGIVYRVSEAGATELARGYGELRGLAYDAAGKRLFLVEHGAAAAGHRLRTLALSP